MVDQLDAEGDATVPLADIDPFTSFASFNRGVRELKTKIVQFPNNVFAGGLGFTEREFFEVEDAASIQEPPTVNF